MATTNYKNKKGATGKKYTTYGDRIKVTYTDGSTRVVRPTDASYASTKKAMEQDIAARKPRTIGSKNTTTAETALGKGVTEGRGLVSSADVEKQAKAATQKRKSQQNAKKAATDKTMKASERAAIINQNAAMNAHKTAQSAAKKAPETIGYAVESGVNQFIGGVKAAPYAIAQDIYTTAKGKNATIDNLTNPLTKRSLGDELRALTEQNVQKQSEIQQKYGYDQWGAVQKEAGNLGAAAVNMAPTLLLPAPFAVLKGAKYLPLARNIGLGLMGMSSVGNADQYALMNGATMQQASEYSIKKGAVDVGTELIGGPVAAAPGVLRGGKFFKGNKLASNIFDIGMEAGEEVVADVADPYLQRSTFNPDAKNKTAGELAQTAGETILLTGLLKGAGGATNFALNQLNNASQQKNNDITPKLIKAGQNAQQEQKNAQNEQQNAQTTQKNQVENAHNAQNGAQKPINNQTINPITNQQNATQNETSQADFQQTQQNPKDIRPILKRPTPEPTIPMEQRNFDNVKDKNVLAYQQEHPEVKPYQQAVANQLLADLDMGVKGGRDVGIDPETRNVKQRGGWKRQQSEPVNRMLDAGLSYQKIRKGLNDIVEDNGKENNTTAKRVELYVNDAVVNGYDSITEGRVEQNNAYHYRGVSREQLLAEQSRLENNFTGNVETDNAIIRELETIHGLLQQMPEQKAQPVNNNITPELQTAKQAQQQNQQQEPTISENETASDSYEDYDVSQLPKDVFDFYNQVGEVGGKANFNIRFVQNLEHDAEGKSDGHGNILISAERANNTETLRRVVAHECYHAMKNTEQWKDIQDLAYKLYKLENPNGTKEQMLQAKIDQYYKRSGGKVQLDTDGAWDEIGAELMGEILSDPKMADRIWNQNPTLAQRITRWLEDMVQKLHDFVFEVEVEDSIYKQAFEAYSEGLQSMRWHGGMQSESRYSIDSNLKEQFDNWMQGHMNENDYFYLGDTPKSLTVFGAKTMPMVMTQDVLVKVTGGKHSIALDELSKLPDQIANPVMLFKGSVPNSFVVLTEMQDKSGKEVITAIHLKRYQNRMHVNRIASVYGKDNIVGYVNGNLKAGNLLDVDTKKAPTWFTSRGLQLPKLVQTIIDAKNNIPQNQQEGNDQTDIRYSLNNKDVVGSQEYKDLLDEHGSMPEGENPTGENYRVEVPRRTAKGNKTRQFVRNVMEASTIDDVTANMTAEELINGTGGDLVHEPLANKAVVDAVNERIANNGWEREYDELHKDIAAGNRVTAEDVTMGIRAIQEAQKAGDYKAAAQMVTDLAIAGTELGQSVQAYTLLKRLTPEGQLLALKRVQQRINKNLVKQGKKPVSEMSEETMIEFLEARGETKRSDIWNREIARMGQETEGTWADKINAVRYTAMLCNPKTHIKNIIGNIAMTAARQPTIAISAALEDARRVKDKALHPGGIAPEQYRSLHNRTGQKYSELKKYAEMNYKTFAKDVLQSGGNRYQNVSSAFENNKRIFGNSLPGRVLEQLAGSGKYSVSSALEAEDMMFKHRTYVSSLVGYMKANGITTKDAALRTVKPNGASIEKGEQYALQQAKKATFTEDNKLANALTNFENLNAGTKLFMGGFMPYKRTPMNILTRGVEYSPAGLIMTGYKMVYAMSRKTGNSFGDGSGYNMNDVFESLGANMTGSAIMTLGILLAREGFLAGAGDEDDERKRKYNQQMGDQNYAVVNPETGDSYTIDWLAPAAMPLFAGVEVYNQLSGKYDVDDETNTARIIEAIGKIADPVFEMSFMQGVANALASYSGDTGDIASTVGSTIITGYAGQFIPSVVGAAARTIDDTVRSSYAPKSSSLTKKGESFLRQQRSKIPFASMQNEASIDVWGNERKREYAGDSAGDFAMRALNNFILPWNYSSNKRTSLDNELERLYQSTGDSGIFPAVASGTINESQQNPKISMTPLEFSKFSTTKGKKSQQYVSDFVNSEAYDQLDDSEKADIISSLYSLATYEARKQVLTDPLRGYNYNQEDYENVLGSGVKPYEYYSTKKRFGGKWATYETVAKYAEHADRMGMNDDKYVEMNEALNDIKADKKNGKSVSGSREKKVRAYLDDELNAGNITDEQWWYWYAMEYSSEAKNSPYEWQWTLHDNTDSTTTQQTDNATFSIGTD